MAKWADEQMVAANHQATHGTSRMNEIKYLRSVGVEESVDETSFNFAQVDHSGRCDDRWRPGRGGHAHVHAHDRNGHCNPQQIIAIC